MGFKVVSSEENEAVIFDVQTVNSSLEYWTEERMRNAVPFGIELPAPAGMEYKPILAEEGEVKTADLSKPPFSSGGKIFFTIQGKDYCGSAEFCADKKLILTAAHCLRDRDTGEWVENIVFQRGYNNGFYKQKIKIRAAALKSYWCGKPVIDCYQWDYGFGITDEEAEVTPLEYEKNILSEQVQAFGYPGNYHQGQKMVYANGEIESGTHAEKTILRMQGNPMKQGCSGGAWVSSASGKVVGVNSFIYATEEKAVYGPVLTNDFESLVIYAKTLV